jgi:signal transduction histidine kinase
MKGRVVTIAICILVAAVWTASFSLPQLGWTNNSGPVATGGVMDLRSIDLDKEHIHLDGDWGFYWHELVSPGDSIKTAPAYTLFPKLWNNTNYHGKTLPGQGYATYTLTVYLPKKRPALAMDVPDNYCSYHLFINGKSVALCGRPDSIEANASPHWLHKTVNVPEGDTLHLLLQMANYWHFKGGPYQQLTLGNRDLYQERQQTLAMDFLLCGCLFMGGLFFLGLYLFGRHDKTILYFALFCAMFSYRIVGTQYYSLHNIFPNLSWFVTVRLEYLTLYLGIAFLVEYVRRLYPEDVNHYAFKLMKSFCYLFAGLVLVTSPMFFTKLLIPFLFVMFVYIVYTLYVYIQAVLHMRKGAIYGLVSMGILLCTFTVLNLEFLGLLPRLQGVQFLGFIIFCFFQSLILSFRFSHDLKESKNQAEEGARAKSEFLSSMSHEIRTPLNSVIGMTHLLLMNETREDQKEQLNVLLFSANNLLSIVNDILDFHKIEAGKIEFESIAIQLPQLASNIIAGFQSFAREKNIFLTLEVDPGLKETVKGDPTRLCQVINNLVHNAIKFTSSGSVKLKLVAQSREQGRVKVQFSVEDTGIGISDEKQKMIFEEFVQADSSTSRSYGGTGLGLAISQRLLNLQGTELHVSSELGKGSVFYFTLSFPIIYQMGPSEHSLPSANGHGPSMGPLIPLAVTSPSVPASEVVGRPLEDVRVLLVEDNPLNVLVTTKVLQRWGAIVDHAGNGKEALEQLDPLIHRLILMDMHMPIMDGYTATLRIREMGLSLPIIALTASVAKEEHQTLYSFYINEVVTKPFSPDQLLRAILKCLSAAEQV